jgi:wyosine [tRNA(Phe)-imidazoG37] synthetase (radical SAM superfamily)
VDRTTPGGPRAVDADRLETELAHLLGLVAGGDLWSVPPFDTAAPHLRVVRDIALAGDGEPTSSKAFAESIRRITRQQAAHGLDAVELQVLTNATLFHRPAVWEGLEALHAAGGRIVAKLDAGTEPYFQRVDGTSLPFQRVLDNLRLAGRAFGLTLQCMFLTLDGVGPSDAEVAAWADRIRWLLAEGARIDLVQVYSVARTPADPSVGPLSTPRLEEIAAQARALGVEVATFPGLAPAQES